MMQWSFFKDKIRIFESTLLSIYDCTIIDFIIVAIIVVVFDYLLMIYYIMLYVRRGQGERPCEGVNFG